MHAHTDGRSFPTPGVLVRALIGWRRRPGPAWAGPVGANQVVCTMSSVSVGLQVMTSMCLMKW
jgi:hypothetical protein